MIGFCGTCPACRAEVEAGTKLLRRGRAIRAAAPSERARRVALDLLRTLGEADPRVARVDFLARSLEGFAAGAAELPTPLPGVEQP